jgi:hypothetical protein
VYRKSGLPFRLVDRSAGYDLPAAALPPSAATPVAASRSQVASPALAGAAGGTEGLLVPGWSASGSRWP